MYEPLQKKTNILGFRPGLIQSGLYSHRRRLQAQNFGFKKKGDITICVMKTKALTSCAVTAKLISAFVSTMHDVGFLLRQLNYLKQLHSKANTKANTK